jgi:glycerol-3-phosphate acyltransferase PlsX
MSNPGNRVIRIAIDAMGGDFAPVNEIQGAILASQENSTGHDFEVIFFGDEATIKSALSKTDTGNLKYSIQHSTEVVTMEDDPTEIIKKKSESSLIKGLVYHRDGNADAFLSVGNTGAVLSAATITLGRLKGVSRPTIGAFFPTQTAHPTFVVDVGANLELKPKYFYEFAVMGSIYSKMAFNIDNPKIGLLNVGEEPGKGTELLQTSHELLKNSGLNFIGNVEGRDILLGTADIIICDGLTGNIILKFAESFIGLLKAAFKNYASKNIFNKLVIAAFIPVMKGILKDFDYQEYGGVPLLGVNGIVLIGHGKSTPKALSNMILKSVDLAAKEIDKIIEQALNPDNIIDNNRK